MFLGVDVVVSVALPLQPCCGRLRPTHRRSVERSLFCQVICLYEEVETALLDQTQLSASLPLHTTNQWISIVSARWTLRRSGPVPRHARDGFHRPGRRGRHRVAGGRKILPPPTIRRLPLVPLHHARLLRLSMVLLVSSTPARVTSDQEDQLPSPRLQVLPSLPQTPHAVP